jgi:uncharacterized membrane protein
MIQGAESHVLETIHQAVGWAALGIEALAVAVVVTGVLLVAFRFGTIRYLFHVHTSREYESYKQQLGKPLLLGLEMFVAADVVRMAALDFTLNNVLVLGLLVLVRTLLSWSMFVEIEGRWPWQPGVETAE